MKISVWYWIGFIFFVIIFLALDLGLFHRRARVVGFREALYWTGIWFLLALVFAVGLKRQFGQRDSLEFLTGYLIELSLSMDNVFVIALVFAWFKTPAHLQHRILFWGVIGALVMRGAMIVAGVALITWLDWMFYVLGAFVVYTGARMFFGKTEVQPEKDQVLRLAQRLYPVSPEFDGQNFMTRWNGTLALTPLALVLLAVETTDLIFAVDSIPAIFAVTTKPFIVFTSNIFAILGLRSLYFVLAGAIRYFRHLKYGLSLVLIFVGIKMLLAPHGQPARRWFQVEIPVGLSLLVIGGIILISIILSITTAERDTRRE